MDLLINVIQITCVYYFFDVVKLSAVAIGNDEIALTLEAFQIVFNRTSEKGRPARDGRLVNKIYF